MSKTLPSDNELRVCHSIKRREGWKAEERELEFCLEVVACVIDHHGENYWPVYELFEEELEKLRSRREKLNKTLKNIMLR
jgi:hypothetical protein